MIKTTQKHFEYFKYICLQWFKVFEFSNWQIHFRHADAQNNVALISFDIQGQIAVCTFCLEWDNQVRPCTKEEIFKTAKHEMLHNFLAILTESGAAKHVIRDILDFIEEGVIHKLSKLIPDSLVDENGLDVEFDFDGSGEGENGEEGSKG